MREIEQKVKFSTYIYVCVYRYQKCGYFVNLIGNHEVYSPLT